MVLVTGATGILGRVITLQLLKQGRKVLATKRPTSNLEDVRQSFRFYTDDHNYWFQQIQWIDLDFEDLEALQQVASEVTEVYHCLGKVSFDPADRKALYHINVNYTKNLLYACENSTVGKFLYVSSISVLDGVNEFGVVDESSDFNPKVPHSHYALSKQMAEMEVWRASAEGLNTIIVNPGVIIGSGNWEQSSGTLFKTFTQDNRTFSGGTGYVDVRDVAEACIKLMKKSYFGQRYVLVSENKTYVEVANQIRAKLNLRSVSLLSENFVRVIAPLRYFGFLIPKLRLLTPANINAVTTHQPLSSGKILNALNFKFLPVAESLDFHFNNYLVDHRSSN